MVSWVDHYLNSPVIWVLGNRAIVYHTNRTWWAEEKRICRSFTRLTGPEARLCEKSVLFFVCNCGRCNSSSCSLSRSQIEEAMTMMMMMMAGSSSADVGREQFGDFFLENWGNLRQDRKTVRASVCPSFFLRLFFYGFERHDAEHQSVEEAAARGWHKDVFSNVRYWD